MYVIEATNAKKWQWISGIFRNRAEAEVFFLSIPESARSFRRIIEIPVTRFPFFIIEDRGFEYGGLAFVRERLKKLVPSGSENNVLLNVYAVRQEFRPPVPGTDKMGELDHWHVTNFSLKPPESKVFDQELAEIVGDA
jgi:hypothetical protein